MLKFTLKKILGIIPTLLVIIFLCFFVMRMAPGSPFDSEKPIDRSSSKSKIDGKISP